MDIMKIALVRLQGYVFSDQFIFKQMTIKLDNKHWHFLFKPVHPFKEINMKNKRIVWVTENKLITIRDSYGEFAYRLTILVVDYITSKKDQLDAMKIFLTCL